MADMLAVLRTEITTDPLTRGYAAKTLAQKAADLNTKYRTRRMPVGPSALIVWASASERYRHLKRAAELGIGRDGVTNLTDAVRAAAYALDRLLDIGLDPNNTDHVAIVNLLVPGVVTAGDRTALQNLANTANDMSRAEELGLPEMSESLLQSAGVS
jgi:hypothetical protein